MEMEKQIRITLVSNVGVLGDPLQNLEKMEKTVIETQYLGTSSDLFIFPEINITGGFFSGGLLSNSDNYKKSTEEIPMILIIK